MPSYISTPENYKIESSDILFDNKKRLVSSKKKSNIIDADNNKINLENFEYLIDSNIFKSIGLIEFEDKNDNTYEFSQIYIDTKKKEVLGTDIKAYLNQDIFKINEKNKPRIFANTVRLNNNQSSFEKGIFTLCDYRKKDKCPPWTIQSSKMLHDRKKKTIYYKIMNHPPVIAEYIWLGGNSELRSKTKVLHDFRLQSLEAKYFPMWNYDGSSTEQAEGLNSELKVPNIDTKV